MKILVYIRKYPCLHRLLTSLYGWLTANGDDIRWIVQRPLISSLLDNERDGKMLDCGCGLGMYQNKMRQRSPQVWAMDIQETNLKYCLRKKLITNDAICGNTSFLPFTAGVFDVVLCSEVIEHITNDRQAVRELARVLKPGGRLIISVPVPPGNVDIDDYGHKREGYSPEELCSLLHECGFSVRKVNFCCFSWSRLVMQIISLHVRYLKINPLKIVLIPVLMERALGITHSPYDLVAIAVKES